LPSSASASNPFTRFLRPQPHKELFRTLADSLDEAVLVLDPGAQEILEVNHAFLLLTGYSRNELGSLTAADLFQESKTLRALRESDDETAQKASVTVRDGSSQLIDLESFPVGNPRQALLVRARSTADRLRAEQRAHSESQRLANFIEVTSMLLDSSEAVLPALIELAGEQLSAAAVGVYRVSPRGPDYLLEGEMPEGFPATLASTELDPLDRPNLWAIGTRPDHPLHRAARSLGLRALRSAPLGSPKAWIGLLVAGWRELEEMPDDAISLMEVLANLVHAKILVGMQREVLASFENDLHRAQQELRSQFQAVNDGILAIDSSLQVLRANRAAARMLGYEEGELDGLPVQDVLVGPRDIMTTLLDVIGHDRTAERNHITLHRRDGTPIAMNLRAVPRDEGSDSRVVLVLSDQSERKAIEDRTESLAQRAILGEVAAIFAHEVRNPINNISTGLQLVASRLGRDHPQHASLEKVRSECTRLDRLMEDVLFFARPLELKFQPVDLAAFMDRVLARWEPRLRRGKVVIHKDYADSLPHVSADERTVEQVIVNLVSNGFQAMPEGGTLSVSIRPRQSDGVELKLADTGPGIPADQIDRIFDPFFTTKKTGTGLGLAISRRIMTAHQGSIMVESFPDAGTVFSLHFKAIAEDDSS
jgi:PAS domain S-box-containing protein